MNERFELEVHRSIAEIPETEWNALALVDPSPFVEWEWLNALEVSACVGDGTGWTPCHVTLRDEKKALVAAAPCYLKTNSEGEFVFDYAWAEVADRFGVDYYPKLVVSVPFTPATGSRILTHPEADRPTLVRGLAGALSQLSASLGTSSVHVLFPPEDEAALLDSAGYLRRYGVQFQWHNRGYSTFEDFLSELPSKKRTQLRREVRQPEKDGVVIETLKPADYTPEVVRTMFDLYRSTVEKFYWGRQYLTIDFFERIAQTFRHRLSWVVARQNGRIVAGAFNVKKGKRLYGRYWGTFVDLPFLHFNVCYYHGVRECIVEGLDAFEPGAGGEHKRVRGFLPTVTHSAHFLENSRMRAVLGSFLQREREAITRFVTEP